MGNFILAAVDQSLRDATLLQLKLGTLRKSANESPGDSTIWQPAKEAGQKKSKKDLNDMSPSFRPGMTISSAEL